MSFKNFNIPISMIEQYKTADPFKTVGMVGPNNALNQLSMVRNPYLENHSLNNIWKNFAQADMTAYSQGNVGGKK
jgi:hypothetical protein